MQICSECKLKGANIGCVQKGCNQTFHYICAKTSNCELDEENFSMFCQSHKVRNNKIIFKLDNNFLSFLIF